MGMAVVQVRIMRMGMDQPFMAVPVGMRLGHRLAMAMAVMFVVDVAVLVFDRLMFVPMFMSF